MAYDEIQVRLVEAGSGKILAERKVAAKSLPDNFIPGKTVIPINSQHWVLVQAEPAAREDSLQTGQLTLTLTPDQPAAPSLNVASLAKETLYSLPTICQVIPETYVPSENIRTSVLLHADDWRQVELVAAQYERAIDAELADIEGIVRDHSVKGSATTRTYKQILVRQRIKTPITPSLPMSEITAALPGNSWTYGGVGFRSSETSEGSDALITNSFAYDLGLCAVYGQLVNGAAAVIGLYQYGTANSGERTGAAAFLDKLMSTHALVLVDWCWRRKIGSGVSGIDSYLEKKFGKK